MDDRGNIRYLIEGQMAEKGEMLLTEMEALRLEAVSLEERKEFYQERMAQDNSPISKKVQIALRKLGKS